MRLSIVCRETDIVRSLFRGSVGPLNRPSLSRLTQLLRDIQTLLVCDCGFDSSRELKIPNRTAQELSPQGMARQRCEFGS